MAQTRGNVYRTVEWDVSCPIDSLTQTAWELVDNELEKLGFTRKDIKKDGLIDVRLSKRSYPYDNDEYPIMEISFYTPETDKEYGTRIKCEKVNAQLEQARKRKEYEKLKKEFGE